MTRRRFLFDAPDRFVPGAVGVPGNRTFFLQARKGSTVASVALDKLQVAALATRLDELLDAVAAPEPSEAEAEPGGLEEPVVELFRVGAMALAWDQASGSVLIEARQASDEAIDDEPDEDLADGPDLFQVRLGALEARTFIRSAAAILAGGRPPCPFCGQPLSPEGHFCPRGNGRVH